MVNCVECNQEINEHAKFCPACGCKWKSALHAASEEPPASARPPQPERRSSTQSMKRGMHKVSRSVSSAAAFLQRGDSFHAGRRGSTSSISDRRGSLTEKQGSGDRRGSLERQGSTEPEKEADFKVLNVEGRRIKVTAASMALMFDRNNAVTLLDEDGCEVYDFSLFSSTQRYTWLAKKQPEPVEGEGEMMPGALPVGGQAA